MKRITSKDLDELAQSRPLLVEHYRHIRKAVDDLYGKKGGPYEFTWRIYRQTREEILSLIMKMKAGKGGDSL